MLHLRLRHRGGEGAGAGLQWVGGGEWQVGGRGGGVCAGRTRQGGGGWDFLVLNCCTKCELYGAVECVCDSDVSPEVTPNLLLTICIISPLSHS